MFEPITKTMFWNAIDREDIHREMEAVKRPWRDLKYIQDAWVFSEIIDSTGLRILEIGGGNSRILPVLGRQNEIWNAEEYLGADGGPSKIPDIPGMRLVRAKIGDFSSDLPDSYFDLIFSVSVIEHIPIPALPNFWKDQRRLLRPGGRIVHAIDLYVGDFPLPLSEQRLDGYGVTFEQYGLSLAQPAKIARPMLFKSGYASNPDYALWHWNKFVPVLKNTRSEYQSIALAMKLNG
jgi:SAM-dependent methyltransferase